MKKIYLPAIVLSILFLLAACSKKIQPAETVNTKKTVTKKATLPLPKVIVIADSAAHRTFDGRYYYDLTGHRYWRSNKDGKYYLYNKSMVTDPAFKKP